MGYPLHRDRCWKKQIALRYPQSIYTYKKMLKDSTVASAVEYVQTRMSSVTWYPKAPKATRMS